MGAGARLAAERDRWPEHWRVADLDGEEDVLLAMLEPTEELRAVIPGLHSTPSRGDAQVLIGVTDRRVVLVGHRSDEELPAVTDITRCATSTARGSCIFPHGDGHLTFDLDAEAIDRTWTFIDGVEQRQSSS